MAAWHPAGHGTAEAGEGWPGSLEAWLAAPLRRASSTALWRRLRGGGSERRVDAAWRQSCTVARWTRRGGGCRLAVAVCGCEWRRVLFLSVGMELCRVPRSEVLDKD